MTHKLIVKEIASVIVSWCCRQVGGEMQTFLCENFRVKYEKQEESA